MAKSKTPSPYISKHAEFFLSTQDDWHGNFPRDTVHVSVYETLSIWKSMPYRWSHVCVWGNNDLGMEKNIQLSVCPARRKRQMTDILQEAKSLPNPLNQDWLKNHGFKYA